MAVDSRTNEQFDEAHIPGAISASAYDTGFATKVAQVVPPDGEVVVVAASDGNELEAAELLAAVGLRVRGFLGGGMSAWRAEERPVQRIEPIDPEELAERLDGETPPLVLDVRNDGRVRRRPHRRARVHIPYGELAAPARRAAARPAGRDDLQGRQTQRPRRLGPAARGLRDDPRQPAAASAPGSRKATRSSQPKSPPKSPPTADFPPRGWEIGPSAP